MTTGDGEAIGIDWALVHRRIAEAARRAEEALAPPPHRSKQILDERARALAEPVRDPFDAAVLDIVTLGVGRATYMVESRYVREVLQTPVIVPVPRTPAYLAGLANVRGELLPVFALHVYYGSLAGMSVGPVHTAILGDDCPEFGILADWIHPATSLPLDAVLGDATQAGKHQRHVQGLTADGRILLDGAALLAERDFYLQS